MKNFLKTLIYIILTLVLLNYFSLVYKSNAISKVSIMSAKNVDVYFIGSSGFTRSISPMKIYEETGITSYNISTSWMQIPVDYYALKENLSNNIPKVVFIDVESFFDKSLQDLDKVHYAIDEYDMNCNKLELMYDEIWNMNLFDKLSFVFPFFRFHDKWSSVPLNNYIIKNKNDLCSNDGCYGFIPRSSITSYLNADYMNLETTENDNIYKDNYSLQYLIKIKELCEENNIEMVLLMPPHRGWSKSKSNTVSRIADENNIRYLDLNLKFTEMKFDSKIDKYDENHVNISGANKVSSYIGQYLKNSFNYDFHHDKNVVNEWDSNLKKYKKIENKVLEKYTKNLNKIQE